MGQKHFYKKFPLAIVLTLLLQIVTVLQVLGQCDDKAIIQALYNEGWRPDPNLPGDNWNDANIDNYPSWKGIETWSERGDASKGDCIYNLDLGDASGTGDIPASIGNFTDLRLLWFDGNELTGTIPNEIFDNTNLTNLYLQGNRFTPSLLSGFENLTNLVTFGFSGNEPGFSELNFPDLSGLNDINQFFLDDHDFNDLPAIDFGNINQVVNPNGNLSLSVRNNKLTFEDLMRFASLDPKLTTFNFSPQKNFQVTQNNYTLNEGDNLTINLGVDDNVNGNSYTWFRDDTQIATTTVNELTIVGVTTDDAGIYTCTISNKIFNEATQAYIGNGNNSGNLTVTSENITVTVEAAANGCRKRDIEALAEIALVPGWEESLFNDQTVFRNDDGCIIRINLANKNISGEFPAAFAKLLNLQELYLEQNNITGTFPANFADLTELSVLHIYENNLGGNLSDHEVVFSLPAIQDLQMYLNGIGGNIPPSIGNAAATLSSLSLGDNGLTGNLPTEIYSLTKLFRFHINGNDLTGSISPLIGNLTDLDHLWISGNNFSGPIPSELGNNAIDDPDKRFWLEDNQFTFGDLIPILSFPNLNTYSSIIYAPQAGFTTSTPFTGTEGQALEVTVDFKDGPNDTYPNLYSWYKDGATGVAFDHTDVKTHTIDPLALTDAGQYEIRVTNPDFQAKMDERFNDENPILEIISTNRVEIIVNEGNNPPTDIELDNTTIDSDAQPNSLVGNLTTIDDDLPNDSHTYTLTNACDPDGTNDNNLFIISDDGLGLSPDFVLPVGVTSLKVCITTTDEAEASFSKEFTIRINVLNNPPTDIELDNTTINSDAQPNSLVGNLTTKDDDLPNDTHTYTLTNACDPDGTNDNALFAISGSELRLAADFELPSAVTSLTVCITTTDESGASFSKEFTIRVNALNNPPTDILLTNTTINAVDAVANFEIGTLSTIDDDNPNDTHVYTFTDDCEVAVSNGLFAINGDRLLLGPSYVYDAAILSYNICITSTDQAGESTNKSFEITIRPIVDDCITNDRAVLEALYDALGGDNWNDKTNWKSAQPLNQWFGVETNENGCVTRVVLEDNNLVGTIPTEVGDFSEILEIHFGKNNISGTIPADFGKLTTLEFLWLNENNLGGQIPAGFFGMSNLTNLYLFQNNLQPPMPNQLNQLTKLLVFGFDNNETPFADNDFPVIGNLTVLQKFYIQNHDFEDVPTITNPALLTEMGLAGNRFTFEDLLPFSNLILEVFLYAPQDSVGTQNAVTLQKDATFTIDLGIDINITNSVYRWYKDGELVEESNSNTFTINQVSKDDEGEYTCEVTNPDAPDLTLYARKTTLTVIDTNLPPPVLTAALDPANPAERIILNWTYPAAFNPEDYTIERSVGDSLNFVEIIDDWTENTYTDGNGLMPGVTYYYRVLAEVDDEDSPYSNIAFVTTNSLPIISDIDKTGAANTLLPFTLADFTDAFTDVDNDPLATVQILNLPTNGQLSLGGANISINDELPADQLGNLVFTPTADFIGTTSFDYNASDGYNYALNPASVNITIEEVEDVDLVVNNPQTNTSQVEAGNEVSISADIAIDGDPTSEEALFVLLLSTDTLPNNGDIELTFANVPTGAPQQINTSVMIPEDLEPGEYFLIYYIDAQQAVTETNEINNVKFLRITILPEGPQVTIMNLITANGDGSNDMLYIRNIESYPDNEVILLDRWGNVVGEFPDYNNDWTPVVGQDIPDFGSYLCIVKLNELQVTVKRMVSIIRDTNQ